MHSFLFLLISFPKRILCSQATVLNPLSNSIFLFHWTAFSVSTSQIIMEAFRKKKLLKSLWKTIDEINGSRNTVRIHCLQKLPERQVRNFYGSLIMISACGNSQSVRISCQWPRTGISLKETVISNECAVG